MSHAQRVITCRYGRDVVDLLARVPRRRVAAEYRVIAEAVASQRHRIDIHGRSAAKILAMLAANHIEHPVLHDHLCEVLQRDASSMSAREVLQTVSSLVAANTTRNHTSDSNNNTSGRHTGTLPTRTTTPTPPSPAGGRDGGRGGGRDTAVSPYLSQQKYALTLQIVLAEAASPRVTKKLSRAMTTDVLRLYVTHATVPERAVGERLLRKLLAAAKVPVGAAGGGGGGARGASGVKRAADERGEGSPLPHPPRRGRVPRGSPTEQLLVPKGAAHPRVVWQERPVRGRVVCGSGSGPPTRMYGTVDKATEIAAGRARARAAAIRADNRIATWRPAARRGPGAAADRSEQDSRATLPPPPSPPRTQGGGAEQPQTMAVDQPRVEAAHEGGGVADGPARRRELPGVTIDATTQGDRRVAPLEDEMERTGGRGFAENDDDEDDARAFGTDTARGSAGSLMPQHRHRGRGIGRPTRPRPRTYGKRYSRRNIYLHPQSVSIGIWAMAKLRVPEDSRLWPRFARIAVAKHVPRTMDLKDIGFMLSAVARMAYSSHSASIFEGYTRVLSGTCRRLKGGGGVSASMSLADIVISHAKYYKQQQRVHTMPRAVPVMVSAALSKLDPMALSLKTSAILFSAAVALGVRVGADDGGAALRTLLSRINAHSSRMETRQITSVLRSLAALSYAGSKLHAKLARRIESGGADAVARAVVRGGLQGYARESGALAELTTRIRGWVGTMHGGGGNQVGVGDGHPDGDARGGVDWGLLVDALQWALRETGATATPQDTAHAASGPMLAACAAVIAAAHAHNAADPHLAAIPWSARRGIAASAGHPAFEAAITYEGAPLLRGEDGAASRPRPICSAVDVYEAVCAGVGEGLRESAGTGAREVSTTDICGLLTAAVRVQVPPTSPVLVGLCETVHARRVHLSWRGVEEALSAIAALRVYHRAVGGLRQRVVVLSEATRKQRRHRRGEQPLPAARMLCRILHALAALGPGVFEKTRHTPMRDGGGVAAGPDAPAAPTASNRGSFLDPFVRTLVASMRAEFQVGRARVEHTGPGITADDFADAALSLAKLELSTHAVFAAAAADGLLAAVLENARMPVIMKLFFAVESVDCATGTANIAEARAASAAYLGLMFDAVVACPVPASPEQAVRILQRYEVAVGFLGRDATARVVPWLRGIVPAMTRHQTAGTLEVMKRALYTKLPALDALMEEMAEGLLRGSTEGEADRGPHRRPDRHARLAMYILKGVDAHHRRLREGRARDGPPRADTGSLWLRGERSHEAGVKSHRENPSRMEGEGTPDPTGTGETEPPAPPFFMTYGRLMRAFHDDVDAGGHEARPRFLHSVPPVRVGVRPVALTDLRDKRNHGPGGAPNPRGPQRRVPETPRAGAPKWRYVPLKEW